MITSQEKDIIGRYEIEATIGMKERLLYVDNKHNGHKDCVYDDGKDCKVTITVSLFRHDETPFAQGVRRITEALEAAGLMR